MDKLLTIQEVMDRFKVGRSTIYREHNALRLPFKKVGRATRIAESDAIRWMENLPQG